MKEEEKWRTILEIQISEFNAYNNPGIKEYKIKIWFSKCFPYVVAYHHSKLGKGLKIIVYDRNLE